MQLVFTAFLAQFGKRLHRPADISRVAHHPLHELSELIPDDHNAMEASLFNKLPGSLAVGVNCFDPPFDTELCIEADFSMQLLKALQRL